MKLRYIILTVCALCTQYATQAQVKYIPPTAHSFSFGIGAGITQLYGDFYGKPHEPALWADINYNVTPYFCLGIQGQYGNLITGGRDVTQKDNGFYVDNNYMAANANFRLSLGAFLTHAPASTFISIISGVYGGAGFGVINNSITTSTKGGVDQSALLYAPINKSSLTTVIPLNVGIDVNLPRIIGITGMAFNVNYQYNFCGSDEVDGYNPNIPFNKHNDTYTYLSAGLRFNFGRIR